MTHRLVSLQALRALAALVVVATHVQVDLVARLGLPHALPDLHVGAIGVDVFFVISGFVMVTSSERLYGRLSGASIFLTRRIFRIVPLYWICTTLYLAIPRLFPELERSHYGSGLVIASYLFVPYARPEGMFPVAGQGWTLNYEMFFYVIFSVAVLCRRRAAVALAAALLAAAVCVGELFGPLPQPLGFWSDPLVLEFALGMGLGLAYAEGLRLPAWPRWILIAVAVALIGAVSAGPNPIGWQRVLGWGLPAALLVIGACFGKPGSSHPWVALPLVAVGDASYALYLFHPFSVRLFRELCLRGFIDPGSEPFLYLALALLVAVAAALAIHYFLERPFTRMLNTAFLPRRGNAMPLLPAAGAPG
jgi:peptidoglycan/LPS O-acetylase OafA/YrhL